MSAKTFKWTVTFEISDNWVFDGAEITEEVAKEMLANYLPYAYGHELGVKITRKPSEEALKECLGIHYRSPEAA